MKDGELRIEAAGYKVLLNAYDEILAERKKGEGKLDEFEKLMAIHEPWSRDLPVVAKGWTGFRYRK
jgi:hypothetical protein